MDIRELATRIKGDAEAILAQLPPPPGVPILPAGGDLQAALDKGGSIALEDGATWNGSYTMKTAGTRLIGAKSSIIGINGAGLYIPPGTRDVQAALASVTTTWDDSAVLVGQGGSLQTKIEDAPTDVVLTINVPTHRGKRAFYINANRFQLLNCSCHDVYDPAGRDSNGILIFNAPGAGTISGGTFEAGSECILLGGGTTGIPGLVPTDIIIENVTLSRPLAWMTDGVHRKVKNSFEIKNGEKISLVGSTLAGCWVDGQVGWAIMLTPRDGRPVRNVLLQDLDISDVGGVCAGLGYDDTAFGPQMDGVTLRRVHATARDGTPWGAGRFLQMQASPANIVVDDCTFLGNGQTLYMNPGKIWTSPTTQAMSSEMRGMQVVGSQLSLRSYGIQMNGNPYAAKWAECWPDGVIEGNTFVSLPAGTAATYRKNLPASNTFAEGL